MNKITLPLVMIASLATLVSCGTANTNTTSNLPNIKKPVVTGVVVTPVVKTNTSMTTKTGSADGTGTITSSGTTTSPDSQMLNTHISVKQTATSPQLVTRKETVSYSDPSGIETIEFNVTVTDGIITAASATPKAINQIAKTRQDTFAADVSAKVVGKKAKDLEVDAIGGSSLTTAAFETFVQSI